MILSRRDLFASAAAALSSLHAASGFPRRIVSTAPGITETLFALGLGDRVVGVTEYCKFPPEAAKLPKVGDWTSPNMEVILSLRPDLIIVQRTTVHDSNRFHAVGLKTLDIRMDRIADIYNTIEAIGSACGIPDRAAKLSDHIRTGLQGIKERVAVRPKTAILFVVGRNPGTLDGIIAVGPNTYLDEVITVAGGRNVLSDARVPWVKVLPEEIVARNPEVILDMGEHGDALPVTAAKVQSEVALWNRYGTVPAVRNHRVDIVADQVFVVPGPRVVECARRIARLLHPEVNV